ncbi:hypothetical protein [Cellulomonas composti]|uniref:MIR domain-containing protein n=1 Tax=Cellulomonas composti TaxID=266130 RepID=A0A511J7D7_9CELL|nr:hypothetical protein [Cellulomonas composti]GEL93898.1 hypothetical protein CCO02nite_05560 [Cellulomonas composti]
MIRSTGFDPAVHGFAFPNAFVDETTILPGGKPITTRGRCGGMAYLSLDHFFAGVPAPYLPRAHFAPERVPPDGHLVADAVRTRLFDSFKVLSALQFFTWSALPDGDVLVVDGVHKQTHQDELPKILRAIDAGTPVPLGLVVAHDVRAVGTNHQVVAYGYERTAAGTTLLICDSNSPGAEVTLTPTADGAWQASNGPLWRGFFVQSYRRRKPVIRTTSPADPAAAVRAGSVVTLAHVRTGRVLRSSTQRWAGAGSSGGREVTGVPVAGSMTRWVVSGPDEGAPVRHGDAVHLRSTSTRSWLTSTRDVRSPLTGQQEVSAVPGETAPLGSAWRVEVDGATGTTGKAGAIGWTAGARVRLVHVSTGVALHSHLRSDPALTFGRQEVTGFAGRDDNDWWTVLELS